MEPLDRTIPVVIVGAGTAALVLALVLAEHGVESLVIDGDRAAADARRGRGDDGGYGAPRLASVSLERPALQVLGRLGAGSVLAAAQPVSRTRALVGDRETLTEHAASGSDLPAPLVGFEPSRLRRGLSELVSERGLAPLETSVRAVTPSADQTGVRVETRGPAGEIAAWRATYAVVTDEAVAEAVGLPALLPTATDSERPGSVVTDIRADLPFPNERRLYVDPPWDPGGRVLLRPQTPSVWRVEWRVPAGSDPAEAVAVEALRVRLDGVADGTAYEILEAQHHPARPRIAAAFRTGPVFRVGDAAHRSAVLGADELDAAIEDVENLGWKLAYALRGQGGDLLLDSYDAERRPAVQSDLAASARAALEESRPTRRPSWRDRALPGLLRRGSAERGSLPLAEPATYRSSPVLQPGAGAMAPELPVLGTDGESGQLSSLRGGPIVVLAIGPTQDDAVALAAAVETALAAELPSGRRLIDRAETLPPHRFVGGAAADATEGLDAAGTALGNLLLVRPDGRLAWKVNGEDAPEEVAAALAEAMLRTVGR